MYLFTKYYKLEDIKLVNLLEDAIQMDREIQVLRGGRIRINK
jgi:hypothetical protein